jgi:rRNA maturation endonuclease Nob1
VRLFNRKSQDKAEIPCPRCKTLVPVGDDVCNVCGWDMLDQYRPPEPAEAEDRAAS